ncbi:hypothetical protein KM914_11930 [Virgibacillus pantothenticus]|uniref:hypothetical protein n=1 Tax=Virgibacillus pantothenticus TaxID=1473 RepID=UPI001C22DD4E|nr:hypothetical protein [Virgibacillus pantothenticus]MBU8567134.1 hypothetical protein [Virgibacillus pantothenticus]MBU8600834.1 hypothetical protein [Virgibacillus pantothenticus]MBU8635286.1 hypothetical protein [Virgibacillus pantothenticus]MBU8642986.1 hypothetical protein [Virgibacillus pantothenticus]MBU8646994.1 hypothetical protein [Virgibacillus pantothenticus]
MIKDNEKERLLTHKLNQKLYFSEIEEKLVRVTYGLMSDNVYTIDRAIPDLIKIINLLELEHEAIMLEINRILELSD